MGRRRSGTLRKHKQSGQGIVSLPVGDGTYKDYLLGPHDSQESRAEYARIIIALGKTPGTKE